MTACKHWRTIVAVGVLAVLGVGLLCFHGRAKPPLRLKFVCVTNEPGTKVVYGVFRLENKTKDYLSLESGCFQQRSGLVWIDQPGTYDSHPARDPRPDSKRLCRAGSTIIFRAPVPADEGSHRLVIECVPCVRLGTFRPPPTTLSYRFGESILRFCPLPPKLRLSLMSRQTKLRIGAIWLQSEGFCARESVLTP